jgi:S1/P1 Nuclease
MNRLLVVLLIVSLLSINASGYGPRGHQLVGAIADQRLKRNRAIANKVRDLLDGLTLQRASTLPDEIKSWKCGDDPSGPNRIDRELQAFINANCGNKPSHTFFHFTDVPVAGNEDYDDGEIGRADFDIVHMIPFCIRVLKGEVPETNDHAITRSIAVILLTHYLGDIHQPLHVGAEFFDAGGNPFEPTTANKGFEDQGGNKLTLFTFVNGKRVSAGKFHGYWDSQTVENAFGSTQNSKVAQRLAAKEPDDWKLTGGIETWAEQLANDILPIAREAHSRLQYRNIVIEPGQRDITSGRAEEKKQPGGTFYAIWASDVVKEEIHKGGWRLAALLEQALQ